MQTTMRPATSYRLGIVVAVVTGAVLLFGIGALGVIGSGGEADLMYLAVLGIGVVGAVVARFRPRGMAWALCATAAATAVVAVIALVAGLLDDGAKVIDLLGLTAMFVALFCLSAWLFWRAAPARSLRP